MVKYQHFGFHFLQWDIKRMFMALIFFLSLFSPTCPCFAITYFHTRWSVTSFSEQTRKSALWSFPVCVPRPLSANFWSVASATWVVGVLTSVDSVDARTCLLIRVCLPDCSDCVTSNVAELNSRSSWIFWQNKHGNHQASDLHLTWLVF